MAATHDIVITKGSYTDKQGQPKKRYENIGKMGKRDDGSVWIQISRLFNPAGVPNPEDSDTVFANIYPIKPKQAQAPQQQQQNDPFAEEDPFS